MHPESYQSMQFLRLPFSCSGDYAVPLPDAASATVPTFFDVQLPRDLLRARSGPRESDILFVLIRGTRRSVRWPLQSRRKGTVAGTRRSVRCPRQSRREGTARGLDAQPVVPASLEGKEQPRGLQPIRPFRLLPPSPLVSQLGG